MAKKIKKIVKKKTKKTSVPQRQEIVLKVQSIPPAPLVPTEQQLTEPLKVGSKYMIPQTWMSEKMAVRLVQKTPSQYVYERPGKGGGKFSYVTGSYVEKVLNYTFGWNWDFEIVTHGKDEGQVWVQGKLTVKDDKGHSIIKSQFGRADIKLLKNSSKALDFGNDLKAASTDALKKCASLLGIASDIYGKTDYKHETGNDPIPQQLPPQHQEPEVQLGGLVVDKKSAQHHCQQCGIAIDDKVASYSAKMFRGKILCREHQKR